MSLRDFMDFCKGFWLTDETKRKFLQDPARVTSTGQLTISVLSLFPSTKPSCSSSLPPSFLYSRRLPQNLIPQINWKPFTDSIV